MTSTLWASAAGAAAARPADRAGGPRAPFGLDRALDGIAARSSGLVRRLREASGGAMVALGLGLLLARRPVS